MGITGVWRERIREQLNGLIFGSVQIIINEGRIVQIEQTKRIRYQEDLSSKSSGPYTKN